MELRKTITFFYGGYGLLFLFAIIYRLFLPVVTIPFVISELNKQVSFSMDLAELMDILLLGIVFSVNTLHVFEILEDQIPTKRYWRNWYKTLFITFLIIYNFGIISHMVANQLNEFMHSMIDEGTIIPPNSTLEQLELGLYFWDEIASHFFTGLGYFMMIFLFLKMERKIDTKDEYNSKKDKLLRLMSFFIGIGNAFGFIEGQWGLVFSGLLILILILILIQLIKSKKHTKPFNVCSLSMIFGYLAFLIIYTIITGIKPTYPYIYQISEVIHFPF
ncbi:MAG: hypothetical protein K9W44_01810 [Candidatus Lokiarchaeota archaeon]|nr:hypothetical protein [Candidatus Harpocratesius repetitus]